MPAVTTLLCKRDLTSAIRCLRSVIDYSADPVTLMLISDGSLSDDDQAQIVSAIGDQSCTFLPDTAELVFDRLAKYPHCRKFRETNVLGRKLFDVAFTAEKRIFYIDSDILITRRISDLFLEHDHAVFFPDRASSYALGLRWLLHHPRIIVPARINTGIIIFPTSAFDLDYLEHLLGDAELSTQLSRTPAWAEQTLWAFLAAKTSSTLISDKQAQIVTSSLSDEQLLQTPLLHFVSSYRARLSDFPTLSHKGDPIPIQFESTERAWHFEFLYSAMERKITSFARSLGTR